MSDSDFEDSDSEDSDSDSEDEMFMLVAARGRIAKTIRPRVNHFDVWRDDEFFMRFRLTRPTVLNLLGQIEEELESPTNRNSSISPINQILIALRFYASGCMLIAAGDFSGIHKTTAGAIIKRVTRAIARLGKTYIKFPSTAEELRSVQEGFYAISRLPRVIGAIDCTHVKLQSPGGENAETFRNRKNYFSLNVQTISDSRLRITDVVARWPGSCHDKTIFNSSAIQARLERGEFGDGFLVGDSGYTLQPYMITPLRNPVLREEALFNEAQIRTRNPVERQYGTWKRRFPVLSLGIRLAVPTAQDIVIACAVLHNLAIDEKEADPPVDPALPILNIEHGQMPVMEVPVVNGGGTGRVQRSLIEYFKNL